jgi:hypothetical protein
MLLHAEPTGEWEEARNSVPYWNSGMMTDH